MIAPASAAHFFWSVKLGTFIMVKVLDASDQILLGNYRLNNCYKLIS